MKEVDGGEKYILRNFTKSPKIVMVIKLRRIRWAVHVASMRKMRNYMKFCSDNKEINHSGGCATSPPFILSCWLVP
jgi:hypothetical protein